MLALLDRGLEDVSASRSRLAWAVQFPRPLSSGGTQTTYVWFDALPNYLTATGFPDGAWSSRWPAQLHVIGKDITRFHSVLWPAMLQAANLPLPERVWAHGFVLLGGERFSKSAGVRLDLNEAIDRYGADAFRYFLLREVPFDADGSFSWERFEDRYNSDLANAWNDFALHPAFVPFVHDVIRYLVSGRAPLGEYLVGALPGDAGQRPGVVTVPGGAGDQVRRVAVNVDLREADPARLPPDAFVAAVPRTAGAAEPPVRSAARQRESEQSLWRYGLMLMLVGLAAESVVGRRS
jgi:hypothetical protein